MRSQIYAHDHVLLHEGEPSMAFPELLSLFTKAVEDADVDAFLELFHGDATYDDVFDGVFTGRAQIRNMFEVNFHGRARDFRWEMHEPVSDGTIGYAHLTLSYTSTMKHNSGKRVVLSGCSQFQLRGEKIASYREWAYGIAGLSQLGTPPQLIVRQAQRESERIISRANPDTHRL